LFGNVRVAIQSGAGHGPWIDDPEAFLGIVTPFLL
jgi:pimeloyl-ACP methyl ester carboxylesterase